METWISLISKNDRFMYSLIENLDLRIFCLDPINQNLDILSNYEDLSLGNEKERKCLEELYSKNTLTFGK